SHLSAVLSAPYDMTSSALMPVNSTDTDLAIFNSTDVILDDGYCEIIKTVTTTLSQIPWASIGTWLASDQINCIDDLVASAGNSKCGLRWAQGQSNGCKCCWRSTFDTKPHDTKEKMKGLIKSNPWRKHKSSAMSNLGSVIYEMNCNNGPADCTDDTTGWNGQISTVNVYVQKFQWQQSNPCGKPSVC
ncbi:hypothetical protein FBU30_002184, partial [Linnemannia zychae]